MKSTRKSLTLMLVMAIFAVSLGFGFLPTMNSRADEPVIDYDSKMIARYTLDEVVTGEPNKFAAIDKDGAALPSMDATTTVAPNRLIANSMEGKYAADFVGANMTLPAFLGESATAFTISQWYQNNGNDWARYLDAGAGLLLCLPNIDSWGAAAPYREWNAWPSKEATPADYANHSNWDSFMNRAPELTDRFACNNPGEWMYITVTVDPATGYKMYKDGKIALTYTADKTYGTGSTVGAYLQKFVDKAKAGGLGLLGGGLMLGDDVRVFNLLSNEEIQALYHEVSALNVTKIMAGSEEVKDLNTYAAVSAGIPYISAQHFVPYNIATGANPDAAKPEVTFDLAKIVFNPTDITTALTGSKSIVATNVADYTITAGTPSTPVENVEAKTTTYTQDYTITKGNTSKVIQIKFVRNDDLSEAMKTLSAIRVSGVLIDGFASDVHDYTYALAPTVAEIPAVTFTASVASLVDVTTNVSEAAAFDGVEFVYTIKIYDKTDNTTVIGEYSITFTRGSSAIATKVVVDGSPVYGFKSNLYYDNTDPATIQTANVHEKVTAIDKVQSELQYPTTATVDSVTIDTNGLIVVTVKDTVSELTKQYAFNQVEFSGEAAYSTDLNATTVEADSKITIEGSATAHEDHLSVGNGTVGGTAVLSGIKLSGVFASSDEEGDYSFGDINSAGVTIVTWVKLTQAPAVEWAGVMYLPMQGGALIANQCQRFTGDFRGPGTWVQPVGGVSTNFVSDTYMQLAIVIAGGRAYYYVDGSLKDDVAITVSLRSTTEIILGRTHTPNDPLGNGDFKSIAVYNEPLTQKSLLALAGQQESAFLTALKIKGQSANITGFGPQVYNYNINYSSSVTNPTVTDFPELEATNGVGDVTNIVKAANVVNNSLTYTITSEANGYSFVYTVTIKFVSSDSAPVKFTINYSGTKFDIADEILESEFTGTGSTKNYTYKVWEGFDITEFVIGCTLKTGQSREGTSVNATNGTWRTTVYAEGEGSTTYIITFEVDASVENPDEEENTGGGGNNTDDEKKGCFGSVDFVFGSIVLFTLSLAGFVVLRKKRNA